MDREGERVGAVAETPGNVTVSKSRKPLDLVCREAGYRPATTRLRPDFQPWTIGNIAIGGLVGLAVDASSGAINIYPSNVRFELAQDPTARTSPPPLAAQPAPAAVPVSASASASAEPATP